jgi:hypothetical protein
MAAASCSATFSELGDTQMEPQEGQAPPLQQHQNSPAAPAAAGGATPKKKRNQPGNPSKSIYYTGSFFTFLIGRYICAYI